jgi:hypothetical protein
MGVVTQLYDPEGDDLIRRAELAGGAENLSQGERWRLENTLRRRRMQEVAGAQPRVTDALAAQRLEAIEAQLAELKSFAVETFTQIIGEEIGEAENRSAAEAKKAIAGLRDEINAKIDALFSDFERAVGELRTEDRRALVENLRETLADAESRIDTHLEKALQTTWERAELEIALCRDELLNVIAEKTYARFSDDGPKLELCEKAIAKLRRQAASLEKDNARQAARNDQLAGVAERVAGLEDAHKNSTKNLLASLAASRLMAKKEAERADGLASEVAHLKTEFERLIGVLVDRKIIS